MTESIAEQKYIYSVIRYVPDVFRGEFVNVGILVGREDEDWEVRQLSNLRRARAIGKASQLDVVMALLTEIGELVDKNNEAISLFEDNGTPQLWLDDEDQRSQVDFRHMQSESEFSYSEESEESSYGPLVDQSTVTVMQPWEYDPSEPVRLTERWLEDLAYSHRNLVQLTLPAPVVASSLYEAVEMVRSTVLCDLRAAPISTMTKRHVSSALKREFARHNVKGKALQEHVSLMTSAFSEQFDFAITNGRALQLTQTWSFQTDDQLRILQQVKGWGWTVENVQQHGATIVTKSGLALNVNKGIPIAVVYAPPLEDQSTDAFEESKEVFEELRIRHATISSITEIAEHASRLLQGPQLL